MSQIALAQFWGCTGLGYVKLLPGEMVGPGILSSELVGLGARSAEVLREVVLVVG